MTRVLKIAVLVVALAAAHTTRPHARDLGLAPGVYSPGPLNAITDVAGVRVGHVTLIEGDDVRTGVTAIIPADGNLFQNKVPGAVFVGNAFGKLAGSTQVDELGTIETPIVLTNTLSVGAAMEGVIAYTLAQPGNERVTSVNALIGETNDSGLNDIRGMHVKPENVVEAIRLEGRNRHLFAGCGRAGRRLYGGRVGTDEFRRAPHHGRNSSGTRTGKRPCRGRRRRFVHDRGGHRRAADRSGLEAPGGAGGIRVGPDRLFVQQRKRRFRDRIFHGARGAGEANRFAAGNL
jgi:D-aminopeptidase